MSTMQAFYTQLFSTSPARQAYWAALAQLARADRARLAALDVGWEWWG